MFDTAIEDAYGGSICLYCDTFIDISILQWHIWDPLQPLPSSCHPPPQYTIHNMYIAGMTSIDPNYQKSMDHHWPTCYK